VKVLVVVKDDPDVQCLVETIFSMDARFTLGRVAAPAEEALESLRTTQPEMVVLEHGLSSKLTGVDAAPGLGELVMPRRDSANWRRRRRSSSSQPTPTSRPALSTSSLSTRLLGETVFATLYRHLARR